MTLVRRLAVRISSRVVRWASPGCKEWAEGLEREAAVIESDWAALRWAIGSTRVLFNFRGSRLASLSDVPNAARTFAASKSDRSQMLLIAVFLFGQPLILWTNYDWASNLPARIGCGMAVFFSICIGVSVLIEWSRLYLNVPPSDDIRACVQFYKAELERDLEESCFRRLAKAIFLIGFCVGGMLIWPGPREHPVCFSIWMVIVVFALYTILQSPHKFQEMIQSRIERLDEFLEEKH
jgi:hypothetical protein